MKRKGIGPNALGSPLKLDAAKTGKKDTKPPKFFANEMDRRLSMQQYEKAGQQKLSDFQNRPKATGGLKPSYPETLLMGGAIAKGAGSLGSKATFNLAKSKVPAWKSAAATILGTFGDEAVIGSTSAASDYIESKRSNKNKK